MSSVAPSVPVEEPMYESEAGDTEADDVQQYENILLNLRQLRYYIESDLFACDAKWTMFVAAATSYRYDTLVKPFPSNYISETTGRDIDALLSVINQTPRLEHVLHIICNENRTDMDDAILDLLHFVLVEQDETMLHSITPEEFEQLMSIMGQRGDLPQPTNVFCVGDASTMIENLLKGQQQTSSHRKRALNLAFHSNKLDCFYSMLSSDIVESEEPLLLNTDLAISLETSPESAGWGRSRCGSVIKCVAVCEFDNEQEHTAWSEKSTDFSINNGDSLRVRYLFFYGKYLLKNGEEQEPTESGWLQRNKYALSLAGYLLLIASIGVLNSRAGEYYRQILRRNANFLWDCCRRILNLM